MEPREDKPALSRRVPADASSPVLAELGAAEQHLEALRARYRQDWEELVRLRREAATLRERLVAVGGDLRAAQVELDRRSDEARRHAVEADAARRRADALARHLKSIHRALFSGHVHDLILRACLALTGTTRGVYVAVPADGLPRIRARVGIGDGSGTAPSPFIAALATRAHETHDAFVCNEGERDAPRGLPHADREDERFRNYAVAPIVLMRDLDGVLIVADKREGRLDEQDIELLLSVGDQATVAVENARLRRELEGAYLSTVTLLADAAEAKDAYTHGHCETVSRYARHVAAALGMSESEVRLTCYAALLHDIGKIGVSDGILNKPGPLLPEERDLMRSHVRVGYDLLRTVPVLSDVADIVLRHHEWYDGSGYPDGLKGDEIPRPARVVAVVDAYCAMVDRRAYKAPFSDEAAREELRRCAGTQFDPAVVDAFLTLLADGHLADLDDDFDAECGLPPLIQSPSIERPPSPPPIGRPGEGEHRPGA